MRIIASFLGHEASNDTGWSKTAIFSAFHVYIFPSFGNMANIIIQYYRYLVPHWLSTDRKTDDLKCLERPFYVGYDDYFCHFANE